MLDSLWNCWKGLENQALTMNLGSRRDTDKIRRTSAMTAPAGLGGGGGGCLTDASKSRPAAPDIKVAENMRSDLSFSFYSDTSALKDDLEQEIQKVGCLINENYAL